MARWTLFAGGAAVLAAGASVWSAFDRDMAAAHARLEGRSTVVDSPFGPIEYAEAGQGPPVLVIHGSGGGFDQGLEMMGEELATRGFRVIAPSRFGYLRSGRPPDASPERQADAFAWLLARLGLERAAVLGASAGALSALQLAIRHPERTEALVLLVPAAYAPDRPPGASAFEGPLGEALISAALGSDLIFWSAMSVAPDAIVRTVLATDPEIVAVAGPQEHARVRAIMRHILPVSRRALGLKDDWRWSAAPPRYALERIAAPVLAVSFEDDLYGTYRTAQYVAAEVGNGRLVGFPTGGHVGVGRQEEVTAAIAGFLAGRPEP